MNHARDRSTTAILDIGSSTGNGACCRDSTEESRHDVAHALSYQFSVGAMMTADHTIGYHAGKQGFDGSKDCDCKGR